MKVYIVYYRENSDLSNFEVHSLHLSEEAANETKNNLKANGWIVSITVKVEK